MTTATATAATLPTCKYGLKCRNQDCGFNHSSKKCRFDGSKDGCVKSDCKFWHPIGNSVAIAKRVDKDVAKDTEIEELKKQVMELTKRIAALEPSGIVPKGKEEVRKEEPKKKGLFS